MANDYFSTRAKEQKTTIGDHTTSLTSSEHNDLLLNYSDLEDLLSDNSNTEQDQYRLPGAFCPMATIKEFALSVLNQSYQYVGQGSRTNMLQNFFSRIDRHGTAMAPLNTLNYGYTFITRPRLNLTGANLRQHPVLNSLYTEDHTSVAFMIRALLDTVLSTGFPIYVGKYSNSAWASYNEVNRFYTQAKKSGLVDVNNPFFCPLMNGLKGISGFPDLNIVDETTEGDFHSGDFSFVKGSDLMKRSVELSLEFKDVQGSVILACFYYWCLIMALQAKGVVMMYPDDIYEQRLNYTVSIYRFVTDTSRRNILWWAKATGCFPKSVPLGAIFNINQGEVTLSSAMNFSIPFMANNIQVNHPGILLDFNRLVERYQPNIKKMVQVPNADHYNYIGLPYIVNTDFGKGLGLELVWKTSNYYSDSITETTKTTDKTFTAAQQKQSAEIKKMQSRSVTEL